MRTMGLGMVLFVLAACGGEAQKSDADAAGSGHASKTKTEKSAKAASSAKSESSSAPTAAASATASANGAAPSAPPTLAALFDGPPDAAIKLAETKTFGKASVGLPDGWSAGASWDSVDSVGKKGGAASLVLLRLDISEAYLDMNVATWVKVPFATTEVKWEPREPAKFGRAHLDAKVAKGTGSIGKDEAEFWQIATALDDKKKYGLVVIAGLKKSADDATRAELVAAVRSIEWK